jgi:predicted permease
MNDVRYAIRNLVKNRGFTIVAVLTLALGVGATTSIFSVVEAVLLRPLPLREPSRVVVPQSINLATGDDWTVAYADFVDWRDQRVFDKVAVYQTPQMDLAGFGEPVRVRVAAVSPEFFGALGVDAVRGRLLGPTDYPIAAARAVVITHELWQKQFGGAGDVVGKTIELNAIKRPIVGVLPPGLGLPASVDAYVPMRIVSEQDPDLQRRDNYIYQAIARLKPGVSLEETRTRMAAIASRVAAEHGAIRKDVSTTATPVIEWLIGPNGRRALWVLLGSVALVLVIGCVNVANLQLARASGRHREIAVRTALGANRGRIIRQLLTENTILALVGGILGIGLSVWAVAALVAASPPNVPRIEHASVNGVALLFALGTSLLSAIVFGLMPAIHASASDPAQVLSEGSARTSAGSGSARTRRVLVVAELSLSMILLVGAGLSIRSVMNLRTVDPGFDMSRVVVGSISLPGIRYDSAWKVRRFYTELRSRLEAAPGIAAAGVASASPLGAGGFYLGRSMLAEGVPMPPEGREVSINWTVATPGYFNALGLRMVAGRDFNDRDDGTSTPVIIVNEQFAKEMFGAANPIGKRVQSSRDEKLLREIVGVVKNVKYMGANDSLRALVWVPYAQTPWGTGTVTVRATGSAASIVPTIRRELAAIDPGMALANVVTMPDAMANSIAADRLLALLLGVFAAIALALAAIGLYGVLSYMVTRRTRELGIRLALGAQGSDVIRLVVREVGLLVAIGLAIGLAGSLAAGKLTRALLFEISPMDPVTYIVVPAVLAAVAVTAAMLPARRAARVDPIVALRSE